MMVGRCISYWNSSFLGDMLVFPGCKWLLGSKCVSNNHLRPWKINMEPTNHPFRKENDLPNLHDYVQNVNFLGCRPSLGTCSSYSGSATTSDRWFRAALQPDSSWPQQQRGNCRKTSKSSWKRVPLLPWPLKMGKWKRIWETTGLR